MPVAELSHSFQPEMQTTIPVDEMISSLMYLLCIMVEPPFLGISNNPKVAFEVRSQCKNLFDKIW